MPSGIINIFIVQSWQRGKYQITVLTRGKQMPVYITCRWYNKINNRLGGPKM